MDLGIAGRVALVGGASRGIGRAIAAELVAEDARVVISARDADRTAEAAREIGAVAGLAWDSGQPAGAAALARDAERAAGAPVEILVLNSGGPPAGEPLSFGDEQWEQAHRSLVLGPLALLRAVLPGMRERGWGRVVSVASTSIERPIASLVLSNAERSATRGALDTIAAQVAADGVTINTLLTGRILTDRSRETHGSDELARRAAAEQVPARRIGRPEEMAAAAAFLCSERAGYVTGASLPVDGGLLRGA